MLSQLLVQHVMETVFNYVGVVWVMEVFHKADLTFLLTELIWYGFPVWLVMVMGNLLVLYAEEKDILTDTHHQVMLEGIIITAIHLAVRKVGIIVQFVQVPVHVNIAKVLDIVQREILEIVEYVTDRVNALVVEGKEGGIFDLIKRLPNFLLLGSLTPVFTQ